MGGRPPGARRRRREALVERPSARRDTRAVKGGSGSRAATPTGLNWDFGGRKGRVWRGCAGAAREQLSSPSVTSEEALPLFLPYPPDPSPGARCQAPSRAVWLSLPWGGRTVGGPRDARSSLLASFSHLTD